MKKLVCMLLCLIAMVALLAGCNGGNNTQTDDPTKPTMPENKKDIVLTIGLPESPYVTDYETNEFTLWLEEKTGYTINVKRYSSNMFGTQFSTETANQEKLPDIMYYFRLNNDVVDKYGEDGFFIDLSPYLEDREKSAEFWNAYDKLDDFHKNKLWTVIHTPESEEFEGATEDGPVFAYPTMEVSQGDSIDFMPMINKEWLKRLNLEAPKTLDELVTVLRAFRDQDANGNGDPNDEIPMLGAAKSTSLGHCILDWIINFYMYYNDANYFNVGSDGKVYATFTDDRYREALTFIRGLVEEGLLNVNTLNYTMKQLRTVVQETDTIGVIVGHPTVQFLQTESVYRWEALDLFNNVFYNDYTVNRDVMITDSCEYPDAAWEVLMAMSSQEGMLRRYYGVEGRDWEWADAEKTQMKKINDIAAQIGNIAWQQNACGIMDWPDTAIENTPENAPVIYRESIMDTIKEYYAAAEKKTDKSEICPWLSFNAEEDEIAKNREFLRKEVKSWRDNFISGSYDIRDNTVWAQYLDAMNRAELQRYIDAGQMCYDRMYGTNK